MNKKIIAIYPGRFQPFGPHHYQTFKWLQNKFGKSNTFIVTSNKTEDGRSPLSFSDKQSIISKYGIPDSNIIQVANPYKSEELLKNFNPEQDSVVFMYGEKDAGRLSYSKRDGSPGYFQKFTNNLELKPFKDHGYVIVAPNVSINIPGIGEMSGTNLRKFIIVSNPESFKDVFGWYDPKLYNLLKTKITETVVEAALGDLGFVPIPKVKPTVIKNINDFNNWLQKHFHCLHQNIPIRQLKYSHEDINPAKVSNKLSLLDPFSNIFLVSKNGHVVNNHDFLKKCYDQDPKGSVECLYVPVPTSELIDLYKHFNNMDETIKKVDNKWVVYPKKGGKRLGTHSSKEKALAQLRAIEINKESINESILLTEGGAFGHMSHPYDDFDFTFADLDELIERSLRGELDIEGDIQEKTDGQNLMITYKDGNIGAARNKSTIVNPMSVEQIASKFSGRGDIETAFVEAMNDLEVALETIDKGTLNDMFKNGQRFLNIEIIFPGTKNVIDYGQIAYLVLLGMVEFDESGNPVKNLTREAAQLQQIIQKVNANQQNTFSIIAPKVLQLTKTSNFSEKLPYFKSKLQNIISNTGLNNINTVGDYYSAKISNIIDSNFNVSTDIKQILIERWVRGNKNVRLTKQLLGDQYEEIISYEKGQLTSDLKKIQLPLELLFLELGVEVMSNIKDFLTASPNKTIQNIRKDLAELIKSAKSSNDPKILNALHNNLNKIKQLGGFDNIIPAEGIVFPYKGRLMKFTGTFAPINQLLGLFRYSR